MYSERVILSLERGLRGLLPSWGLAETAPVRLLTISENATFVAEDEHGGPPLVFRVHRPGYHTKDEILSELAWVTALAADGVAETPVPLADVAGRRLNAFTVDSAEGIPGDGIRHVAAFAFVAGREPDPANGLAHWYGVLGATSARLHAHSRAWSPPQGFRRKVWDLDTTVGPGAYWGDWRQGLGLGEDGRATLGRTVERLGREIGRYGRGPERFGLIHADLRPANLIVDGDRLTLIDFDDCGFGWFMYDFAAATSFMEHEPYLPELRAAWLQGYRSVAPLAAADEAMLPAFAMLRRIMLTAWVSTHRETPTAQAMGIPFTEGTVALAERYLARSEAT